MEIVKPGDRVEIDEGIIFVIAGGRSRHDQEQRKEKNFFWGRRDKYSPR